MLVQIEDLLLHFIVLIDYLHLIILLQYLVEVEEYDLLVEETNTEQRSSPVLFAVKLHPNSVQNNIIPFVNQPKCYRLTSYIS